MKNVYKVLAVGGVLVIVVVLFLNLESTSETVIPEGMFLDEQGQMSTENQLVATGDTFDAEYTCEDEVTFMTRYNFGVNTLTVEVNDTEFELEQKVDQLGARYGTRDDSVVFYEAEGVATLTTPDIEFESCVATQI